MIEITDSIIMIVEIHRNKIGGFLMLSSKTLLLFLYKNNLFMRKCQTYNESKHLKSQVIRSTE